MLYKRYISVTDPHTIRLIHRLCRRYGVTPTHLIRIALRYHVDRLPRQDGLAN